MTEILDVPALVPGVIVLLLLVAILHRRLAAALDIGRAASALLLFGVGLPILATLTPSVESLTEGMRGSGTCDMERFALASANQLSRRGEVALNVLMLVPLGAGIGLLPWRRSSLAILGAAVVLPPAIELTQWLVIRLGRECQSGDVIDNLTGLVIGLLATIALRWVWTAYRGRAPGRMPGPAGAAAGVCLGILLVALLAPGAGAPPPPPLPSIGPTPSPVVTGRSVHVDSVPGLLDALADDEVAEIVVADGTYQVTTAGTQAAESLWIGQRFATRTRPVTVRAETKGGVTFDGAGAAYFGGISFQEGAHDQTWQGFVFANGTPTQTGVVTFGGYAGQASAHHITLRDITIDRSVTSTSDGALDHGFYIAEGLDGPHDLVFEDIVVDGRGGIDSAFQFYGSEPGNPNAWNVRIHRLAVTGTEQAIILWDPTLRDITIDTAVVVDAQDFAVRYESPGATNIVLANVTSTGSGSGQGFHSSQGKSPPGLTFINDSLQ